MRKPHYWKRAGASSAPSEIICVDTETWHGDKVLSDSVEYHTLRIGCALAYRLERGKRTRVRRITFRDANEFWELVRSRLNKRRPVWIVGHNLPYDLGVLNGWKIICNEEYETNKACVSGQMFFIKGWWNGYPLNFLDTVNYYHCSLAKVGKSVGMPKLEMPVQEDSDEQWEKYCRNDVEVTARGIDSIIQFNRINALGAFQPSIAGFAFSGYRSAFMRDKILVHSHQKALRMERGSYYGGIVDCAYIGEVPSEHIYELDVCSMYPAVCRNSLPYYFVEYSDRISISRVRRLSERYMLCADVQICNTTVPYPVRLKSGTYYPIGSYRTTLAHPELMDAMERGVVSHVYAASWYRHAPIFKEYMEYFVAKKIAYHNEGNDAFENVCKLFATNLYGKTGQLTPRWLEWGQESLQLIEEKYGLPIGTLEDLYSKPPDVYDYMIPVQLKELPEPIICRSDYGIVEIKCGEFESRDSCPAIAACVTSYARLLLRTYQRIAGVGGYYYSDTDSLWCNTDGISRLDRLSMVRTQQLGYLDFKDLHFQMHIHGPKDYDTDITLKRKGIRPQAKPDGNGGWIQLQFPGALQQIRGNTPGVVAVERITKHLHRVINRCVVLDSGFTRPLVFPGENPERTKEGNTYALA